MPTPSAQSKKSIAFVALHERANAFVIPNVFDGASARMMASLGFEAVATSSGVQSSLLAKHDGQSTRPEALAHAKQIVEATDLPVSADLENGFGDTPADVETTIRQAAEVGLVGGSIEDGTRDPARPIYEIDHATERIEAAVATARSLPFKFVLTARAENFVRGVDDLDDTIRRLQAYEAAGADVLMAPGLPDLDAVEKVCSSVSKPVNFMAGIPGRSFSVAEVANAGARRISLATSIYSVALAAAFEAAREIRDDGTFGYLERGVSAADWGAFLRE